MNLNIVNLACFKKDTKKLAKKHRNFIADLKTLYDTLQDDPEAGIKIGIGLYKIRLKNSSIKQGKSGGFRVIYYYLDTDNNLFLVKIFSKTQLDNVNNSEILELLKKNL
ncbi:MAG: type II toxin-antitoxin system RelE/ParE family toxin [Candidatus Thiodubiliella endoseptemdiera]|uniref:Type II toxin-antitoxin system RelE/ParE family toxin n=1 Tax=Candidatus Thiodubiliella endoseptemdiera TaxID=2738886 RepID=A0A853F3S8_9GAMM|nr:type II toxin-antitoxin system RelE/ParE family toxin [Candidatus Thiodubiliella endoseptemdiera]